MTLEELEQIPKTFLLVEDVAPLLGMHPQSLRMQARDDPERLGFPTIVCGTRTLIPKAGFIHYCKYGRCYIREEEHT